MAKRTGVFTPIVLCTLMVLALSATSGLAETPAQQGDSFPRPLESYEDADGIWSTLRVRASAEPFNLVATLIFLLAIVHTFLARSSSRSRTGGLENTRRRSSEGKRAAIRCLTLPSSCTYSAKSKSCSVSGPPR